MKILVFSDSHNDIYGMEKALRKHRSCEVVVFCGDGNNDIQEIQRKFPDKMYLCVKGNNDWYCDSPYILTYSICGKTLFITHGHNLGVKSGYGRMIAMAHRENADILIFGHTHMQVTTADGKMLVLNPGSIGYNDTYSIIDINEKSGTITATEYPDDKYGPVVIKDSF